MKTIITNNAIAKVMGAKPVNETEIWLPIHGICRTDTIDTGMGKTLHYHDSWDWLIPVVEKIYKMDKYYEYVDATSGQFENKIELTTCIKGVYDNVRLFIEWYQ